MQPIPGRARFRGVLEILAGLALLMFSFAFGGAGGGAFLVIGMCCALLLMGTGLANCVNPNRL